MNQNKMNQKQKQDESRSKTRKKEMTLQRITILYKGFTNRQT